MGNQVVIIGAPRSGTNMLRDMLVRLPGVGTWPCDEINYIWRHGNIRFASDEFTVDHATPKVQSYINKQFSKLHKAHNIDLAVEKTCANSLRVGFVDAVLPQTKYIFIVRDGMDAVGSALQRWTADLDISYIFNKARYVPPADLPYYAFRYLYHRIYRQFSNEKRLALWGPAMQNIDLLLQKHSLTEVCALQWKACVDKAESDFSLIEPARVFTIKYEDFVRQPVKEFAKIAEFLNKDVPDILNDYLKQHVSCKSIGKGRASLGDAGVDDLRLLIGDTLERYGYK